MTSAASFFQPYVFPDCQSEIRLMYVFILSCYIYQNRSLQSSPSAYITRFYTYRVMEGQGGTGSEILHGDVYFPPSTSSNSAPGYSRYLGMRRVTELASELTTGSIRGNHCHQKRSRWETNTQ